MADDLEQDAPEPASIPEQAESVEPVNDPELASLLEEYDSQVEQPAEPVEQPPPFADEERDEIDAILRAHEEPVPPDPADQPGGASGLDDVSMLKAWAASVDAERAQQREQADLANVLSMAKRELNDLPGVPGNFAERWLHSEYQLDSRFREAWNNRYQDDASFRRAEKTMAKKFRAMRREAASLPDPLLSADKAMIQQAMKAGSQATPPPKAPPDYARMSDAEFAAQVKKEFDIQILR